MFALSKHSCSQEEILALSPTLVEEQLAMTASSASSLVGSPQNQRGQQTVCNKD